jgi:hypothetical protein
MEEASAIGALALTANQTSRFQDEPADVHMREAEAENHRPTLVDMHRVEQWVEDASRQALRVRRKPVTYTATVSLSEMKHNAVESGHRADRKTVKKINTWDIIVQAQWEESKTSSLRRGYAEPLRETPILGGQDETTRSQSSQGLLSMTQSASSREYAPDEVPQDILPEAEWIVGRRRSEPEIPLENQRFGLYLKRKREECLAKEEVGFDNGVRLNPLVRERHSQRARVIDLHEFHEATTGLRQAMMAHGPAQGQNPASWRRRYALKEWDGEV